MFDLTVYWWPEIVGKGKQCYSVLGQNDTWTGCSGILVGNCTPMPITLHCVLMTGSNMPLFVHVVCSNNALLG